MYRIAIFCVAISISWPTAAAGVIAGKVTTVRVDEDGRAIVTFDTYGTGTPTCVTAGFKASLAFNLQDPGGKGVLALLLFAKAQSTPVIAYGSGACNIYSGILEDWTYGATN